MYLCEVCGWCTKPRQSKLVHVISRAVKDLATGKPRKEIAREIAVCPRCKQQTEQQVRHQATNGAARRLNQPVEF